MWKFSFLQSAYGEALAKTIKSNTQGELETEPYPFTKHFHSHTFKAETWHDAYALFQEQAALGRCVLKGQLNRELVNEPRAGSTATNDPTNWLTIDIDGLGEYDSVEDFIQDCLPPELHNVSYFWQPSSSSRITKPGLNAHAFFALNRAVPANVLRDWLCDINLNNEILKDQLSLNKSGLALLYKLDVTTCQNDKLIYIAPPNLIDIADPWKSRWFFVEKDNETAVLNLEDLNPAVTQAKTERKIAQLRKDAGLPKKTAKYKTERTTTYLANPDQGARVTSIKERGNFVYLNLNGGDSWGYFHAKNNPKYLHNFKGEPILRLCDLDPDYYREVQEKYAAKSTTTQGNREYFVLRHTEGDAFYCGYFNHATQQLTINRAASVFALKNFMDDNGCPMPDPIPEYEIGFNPHTNTLFDPDKRFVNLYRPSPYMLAATQTETSLPPNCETIIRHVFADNDEAINRFLNWLAFIYQRKEKTLNAWILQGTEGTGKGILFNRIIMPTLGPEQCAVVGMNDFESDFNGFLSNNLITLIDEGDVDVSGSKAKRVANLLKRYITDDITPIRQMYREIRQVRTYSNFIITSNHSDSIPFDAEDRRHSVSPRQNQKLQNGPDIVDALPDELQQFTNYLLNYEVDEKAATTCLVNEAKTILRNASASSIDTFIEALREQDLLYFLENYDLLPRTADGAQARRVIMKMCANPTGTVRISLGDMHTLFTQLIAERMPPARFRSLLSKRRTAPQNRLTIDDRILSGWEFNFNVDVKTIRACLGQDYETQLQTVQAARQLKGAQQ